MSSLLRLRLLLLQLLLLLNREGLLDAEVAEVTESESAVPVFARFRREG